MKRNKSILKSEGFNKLILKSFKIETINDYTGITGTYDGYICDIYYNWMTFVKSRIGKAFVVNIYFIPPELLHEIHNANYHFIMSMRAKYSVSRWSFKKEDFDWQEGAIVLKTAVGYKNPSYEKMEEAIKLGIEILKKENLKPISREDLIYIRNNFPYQSVPQISIYHKKKD